jgi:predicted alpha/beta superfamily hydrolase
VRSIVAIPFLAILLASPDLKAQDEDAQPITVGSTISLVSDVLGERRDAMVYTPPGYDGSDDRYPVLYVLDGEYSFQFTIGIVDFLSKVNHIPDMIVVGIVNNDRTRDYTPQPGEAELARYPRSGGAVAFSTFLEAEFIPHIEHHYRTQPYRILAGHSLGGLFVVNALMTQADLFDAFIGSSPSLYWNDGVLLRQAKELLAGEDLIHGTLFFSMGDERDEMVAGTNALSDALEAHAAKGFAWRYEFMQSEDHSTTPFVTIYKGLEFIYADYHTIEHLGQSSFQEYHQRLLDKYGYEIVLPLRFLFAAGPHYQNRSCRDFSDLAGYWHVNYPRMFARLTDDWLAEANGLVAASEYECAISLYRLVADADDTNVEAFKGMGAALHSAGDRAGALESYRAALRLRPDDEDLKRLVEELSGNR